MGVVGSKVGGLDGGAVGRAVGAAAVYVVVRVAFTFEDPETVTFRLLLARAVVRVPSSVTFSKVYKKSSPTSEGEAPALLVRASVVVTLTDAVEDNRRRPYRVGDGVVTFGVGDGVAVGEGIFAGDRVLAGDGVDDAPL